MGHDLEHLQDHIDLIATSLELRLRNNGEDPGDATARSVKAIEVLRSRIDNREKNAALMASMIFARLDLSKTEQLIVWSLAALALSSDVRAFLSSVSGDGPEPTLRAIRLLVYGELVDPRALSELSDHGRLRAFGIIDTDDTTTPESRQTWRLSPRILSLLHGMPNELSDELAEFCSVRTASQSLEALCVADGVVSHVEHLFSRRAVVVAHGLAGTGRGTILTSVAVAQGRSVLHVDASRLAKDQAQFVRQLRRIALECHLLRAVPLLGDLDALPVEQLPLVQSELLVRIDDVVLITAGSRLGGRWDRPWITVDVDRPRPSQLATLWLRELGCGSEDDGAALATRYPLAPAFIHRAAKAAIARAVGSSVTSEDVAAGVRSVLDDRLGQFARRVVVTQTWNDIVLPVDHLEAIQELVARVRGRNKVIEEWGFGAKVGKGLGVTALFSGPPGTGKTMLASLIAQELGLELYQVDLGKVVSKWIGETEKNLGALFDAAEAGHAILLFDEADALFGKRTDVKSSNDRHANLETNYLLQRLESYTGICLLTTNHDSHIDPAFQRRLSLHLRIDLPDIGERVELWRAMLPPAAPVTHDIDFDRLAQRYAMSGGYIRNAVLRAAFVAADRDRPITHDALERAARREYEGMGKIVAG